MTTKKRFVWLVPTWAHPTRQINASAKTIVFAVSALMDQSILTLRSADYDGHYNARAHGAIMLMESALLRFAAHLTTPVPLRYNYSENALYI
jgi:hypothetical protein